MDWNILYYPVYTIRYDISLFFSKENNFFHASQNEFDLVSFSEQLFGNGRIALNYTTVYPLTMFLRVVAAQVMIMLMF